MTDQEETNIQITEIENWLYSIVTEYEHSSKFNARYVS